MDVKFSYSLHLLKTLKAVKTRKGCRGLCNTKFPFVLEDVNCLLQNLAMRQYQKCILHCDNYYFHFELLGNKDINEKREEAMGKGTLDGSREEK